MSVRRTVGRAAVTGAVLLVLVACLPLGSASTGHADVINPGPCSTAPAPVAPTGTLSVVGGPKNSTGVDAVPIQYTFHLGVRVVNARTGAEIASGCERETENATTNLSGGFAFAPALPATTCESPTTVCVEFSGPFGPYSVLPTVAPPAGFVLGSSGGPTSFDLRWVYELASVQLNLPGPSVTLSPGAPTAIVAEPKMANGSASPLHPTFTWSLSGTGWSFSMAPSGPNVTIVAAPGAGVGLLSVRASATAAGVVLDPPATSLTLLAQATVIDSGELDRTTIDAGSAIRATVLGVGAPGYAYSASVTPGLGLPTIAAPCRIGNETGGVESLRCVANVTYPSPGVAQPTARLTNGFSTSDWVFASVTIATAPEISIEPTSPTGYVGAPVPIGIATAAGTGTAPYAVACLDAGPAGSACQSSPGPAWTFAPTFATPGTFAATAWAIDSEGENGSTGFSISIVPTLVVGPVGDGGGNATAGTPLVLSSTVAGGVLPIRYWWNASGVSGSFAAGTSPIDGRLAATIVPTGAGAMTVSLTVVDALGSERESVELIAVGPAPPFSVGAVVPPPGAPVTAGAAFEIVWGAEDQDGAAVHGFAAPVVLTLDRAGAPANGSVSVAGVGIVPPLGNGTFGVPGAGWIDGELTASITVTTAGPLSVSLGGTALPGLVEPVRLSIAPDRSDLRLFAPRVAVGDPRGNSTFWQVTDRYGNPAPGAELAVRLVWGAASRTSLTTVFSTPGNTSGAWVNFTAPGPGSATLSVIDAAGDVVVGPLVVPSLAPGPPVSAATVTLATAVPVGALGAVVSGLVRRRARSVARTQDPEADLRRLAEGRSQVLELVRRAGAADLAELEAGWRPSPPPADLSDWLASLVADGSLSARIDPDGRARFYPVDGRAAGPRITFDPEAFERAQRRRDESPDGSDL